MARSDRTYGKPDPDENEQENTPESGQTVKPESTGGGTGSGSTSGQTDAEQGQTPPASGSQNQ